METTEILIPPKHVIKITRPSEGDVEYLNEIFKRGIVREEDLLSNMSFIKPDSGQEKKNENE